MFLKAKKMVELFVLKTDVGERVEHTKVNGLMVLKEFGKIAQ